MAKAKENTLLAFAALTALTVADLCKRLTEKVKVHESVDKAKAKVIENLKEFAKEVAAFKRLYTLRLNSRDIPGDTTFKKYWKDNVGGKLPGRAESLAALFNTLVLMLDKDEKPMLAEAFFDSAKTSWLETANANIAFARKAHGENWRTCDDVLDTINALSKPGDAQETLDEIRKRQKGEKDDDQETGEAAVAVTPKLASEYLIAAIRNAQNDDAGKVLFILTQEINDAWSESQAVTEEMLNDWNAAYLKARELSVAPHLEVVTAEMPEAIAA